MRVTVSAHNASQNTSLTMEDANPALTNTAQTAPLMNAQVASQVSQSDGTLAFALAVS